MTTMPGGWLELPGWQEPIGAFISWQETAAIFVVILILFGPKSIPEVARLLGKIMQQFREASAELQRNLYLNDVRDLQRELRDSWRTKPERMRTVQPRPASDEESHPPASDEDPYPARDEQPEPATEADEEDETGRAEPTDENSEPKHS